MSEARPEERNGQKTGKPETETGRGRIYLITPLGQDFPIEKNAAYAGVDAGYRLLKEKNITPAFVLGDFDSLPQGEKPPAGAIRLPVRKNEPDSELAVQEALQDGYTEIILWGGISGRLDHTLANIRLAVWKFPGLILQDASQKAFVLLPGDYEIEPDYAHLSFFAMEPSVFSETNVSYPLDHQELDQKDLFTLSNSFVQGPAKITVHSGRVLCVLSNVA